MLIPVAMLALAAAAPSPPSSCLKTVFDRFCLGGPVETLPPGGEVSGNGRHVAYPGVAVTIFDGRVASVGKGYIGTWMVFREQEAKIAARYGEGVDHSYFPEYADDLDSREMAIHVGKARAMKEWKTEDGYTVRLSWNNRTIVFIYLHDELVEKIRQRDDSEL